MKRFTVEIDHEFEVAGELFHWVYPYWEDIANVFDRDADADEKDVNGDGPTIHTTIADFIERIELFIDPDYNDGRTRWRELSQRRKDPIPHSQYAQIYRWLLEVTSGSYPTEQSSDSADGQPPTAATSTAGSS